MVITYQGKWYGIPLAPCISGIATRSLNFAGKSTTTPLPHKHLIFSTHFKSMLPIQEPNPSDIHYLPPMLT